MLDCKIPPILVLIIAAGIVVGIPYIFPFYGIRSVVLSVLFIVLGVIVALLGVWEFRKSKTTLNPTTPKKVVASWTRGFIVLAEIRCI